MHLIFRSVKEYKFKMALMDTTTGGYFVVGKNHHLLNSGLLAWLLVLLRDRTKLRIAVNTLTSWWRNFRKYCILQIKVQNGRFSVS